jgi:hypothetical protein
MSAEGRRALLPMQAFWRAARGSLKWIARQEAVVLVTAFAIVLACALEDLPAEPLTPEGLKS